MPSTTFISNSEPIGLCNLNCIIKESIKLNSYYLIIKIIIFIEVTSTERHQ